MAYGADNLSLAQEGVSLFRDLFSYSSDPRKVLADLEVDLAEAMARGATNEVVAIQKQIKAQRQILQEREASAAEVVLWNRIGQVGGVVVVVAIASIPIYLFSKILTNPSKRPAKLRKRKRQ